MIRIKDSRAKRNTLLVIAAVILIPGAYGFIEKLIQFFRMLRVDRGVDFTLVPISNYLFVAAGMACMLVWAVLHGMFRDIEAPKFDMLEREEALERGEGRPWSE